MTIVFYVNGMLLAGLGVTMLLPALIDVAAGNPDWIVFTVSALVTWTLGTLVALASRQPVRQSVQMRVAFVLTASTWVSLSAFSALPFLALGLDYNDAFFEAVSGFTTTGSTVLTNLDTLAPGLLFWRALLQWIGGVGIVLTAIIALPFLRIGGLQLFRTESSDRSEKLFPRAGDLVRYTAGIYVLLTFACALLYAVGGMSLFDALCHAMTTLSTGGFANYDTSFGHFSSPLLQWTASVFMLAGAVPFVAYISAVRGEIGRFWRLQEVRGLLIVVGLAAAYLTLHLVADVHMPPLQAMRQAVFNVISIVTTTGYASSDYTGWGASAVGIFFVLIFVGGCTGSTSGAIKIYRFQVLWQLFRAHISRLERPHRLVPVRYGGQQVPDDVPVSVLLFITTYLACIAVTTVLLSLTGLDILTAFSGAATAIGNVGPGFGPLIGPAGNFAALPDTAKWILCLAMLLGRLELFTLLLLADPEFWRH